MRLLAKENIPGCVVDELRARGHDVGWVRTDAPGSGDAEVLGRAVAEQRLLLTFDKDFGELAFRHRAGASCGIVLFRIAPTSPADLTRITVAILESRTDWPGHFSVVEDTRIRMTPLPS